MDDPALDARRHAHALDGLARINRFSRSSAIVWRAVRPIAARVGGALRVLDVATGAGDVPVGLCRRAAAGGISLEMSACDISPPALRHASQRAQRAGAKIEFFELNAVTTAIPQQYDVVVCSLFLHHLSDGEAISLLRNMATASRHALLVNDLRRCRRGLWLARLGTRVLSRSPVVHVDGPRSVLGAYSPAEALALAQAAGLGGATVARRWPFRFLLQWSRA